MPKLTSEFSTKITRLRGLLDEYGREAVLLRRVSSFAWATCGAASYVNIAASEGAASLIITRQKLMLVTNNIEAPRLEQEEKLAEQGWEFHVSPWEESLSLLYKLSSGLALLSDVPFPGSTDIGAQVSGLRSSLTREEGIRFRELGRLCAAAVTSAVQAVRPGMREHQLAGLLAGEALQRGVQPIVNLVATDERAFQYRHPLPTEKALDKYAMLVLCGSRSGLVCSLTRLLHFGPLPSELQSRISAVAAVNAVMVGHSRPGVSLGEVFASGQQAYADAGFPEEWRKHHQGGIAGYQPREHLATPFDKQLIALGQAMAWNPSIAGTKAEDTVLVGGHCNEILTHTPLWPTLTFRVPDHPEPIPASLAIQL